MRIYAMYASDSWWGRNHPPDVLDREDGAGMAGGETYMVECAMGLAAAGHEVQIFSSLFTPGRHKGVWFRPIESFGPALASPPDAFISFLSPHGIEHLPPTTARLFAQQCNHLDFGYDWMRHCDAIVAASANHAAFLRAIGGTFCPIEVVHNGCHLDAYPENPPATQDRPPLVGYWSSPDRGLHHLLAAWPHVLRLRPDARLRVHYEIDRLLKLVQGNTWLGIPHLGSRMRVLTERVLAAKGMPGVTFTGMVSRKKLRRMQLETRVMCYPLDPVSYTEGMGGSVSEAAAAGCLPLLRAADAFPSVYSGGARWIEGDTTDPNFPMVLAEQIVKALDWTGAMGETPTRSDLRALAQRWSWANARAEMVRVIERSVARKRGEPVPETAFPLESP